MISLMTRIALTPMPAALPAASSPAFPHRLLPAFAGSGGAVRPQATTRVTTQLTIVGHAPQMSGVRAGGLPGYPSAPAQAFQSAVDARAIAVLATAVRTSNVPTTTVRNEKHDPGPSVWRPPV
jgi:hypothetical protein